MIEEEKVWFLELTASLVSAYVESNRMPASELPALIGQVNTSLTNLARSGQEQIPEESEPAVSIRKSITPDHIVCLEDGKKFRSMKRHLAAHHGLSPAEYRVKWKLPADYPIVSPNYAAKRSELAKRIGLGRATSVEMTQVPTRPGRKKGGGKPAAQPKRGPKKAAAWRES